MALDVLPEQARGRGKEKNGINSPVIANFRFLPFVLSKSKDEPTPIILNEVKNLLHTLEKSLNYLQPIPAEAGIQKTCQP